VINSLDRDNNHYGKHFNAREQALQSAELLLDVEGVKMKHVFPGLRLCIYRGGGNRWGAEERLVVWW
jgi:hypothetical protein